MLVADLNRRSHEFNATFDRLTSEQRIRVIQGGLEAGGVSGRLYNGAVFLAQAAYFGGLWNQASACPQVGFEGPYNYPGPDGLTYADPHLFLAAAITADGNPE